MTDHETKLREAGYEFVADMLRLIDRKIQPPEPTVEEARRDAKNAANALLFAVPPSSGSPGAFALIDTMDHRLDALIAAIRRESRADD